MILHTNIIIIWYVESLMHIYIHIIFYCPMQLTSKLGEEINCTYTELVKIKAKLELLFVADDALNTIFNTYQKSGLSNTYDDWLEELACQVNANGLNIINSAFKGNYQVAC